AANENALLVRAVKVDVSERWNPGRFDDDNLTGRVKVLTSRFSANRIVQHIAHCAKKYHCFAAKNFFLGRYSALDHYCWKGYFLNTDCCVEAVVPDQGAAAFLLPPLSHLLSVVTAFNS
nr:hypothetical protein [Candidatus Desulfobia pelagia]